MTAPGKTARSSEATMILSKKKSEAIMIYPVLDFSLLIGVGVTIKAANKFLQPRNDLGVNEYPSELNRVRVPSTPHSLNYSNRTC
jgi:hypothetical protein